MVQHPSAVGYHPQPVAPAAAPPGSAVHLHGVVAAPGALLHGSAQHPLPDTPQVPPTSAVNNSSVLPQLEVNPSAPVGPPTNNNLLLLTAENSELREKVAALTKDYNGEVEKLTTFKQSVMKILHEEREQLESEKSKIQAERDDLLYQGVDGEEVTLSLQRRLQAALAEIGSLGEISKEQDKALSFLIARRKNLEEFIMEGDKVMAEEVLGRRLRSSSPSKEGPQGTTSSRKPAFANRCRIALFVCRSGCARVGFEHGTVADRRQDTDSNRRCAAYVATATRNLFRSRGGSSCCCCCAGPHYARAYSSSGAIERPRTCCCSNSDASASAETTTAGAGAGTAAPAPGGVVAPSLEAGAKHREAKDEGTTAMKPPPPPSARTPAPHPFQTDPKLPVAEQVLAVQKLAAQKTKALMRSIDLLKKENLELKRSSQDHKRTNAFRKLEAELGRQDAIIASLLKEKAAGGGGSSTSEQAALESILSRLDGSGPARVKVLGRQELMFQAETYKAQLLKEKHEKLTVEKNLTETNAQLRKEKKISAKLEAQMRDAIEDLQDVCIKKEQMASEKVQMELRLQKEYEGTIQLLATECEAAKLRVQELEEKFSEEEKQKKMLAEVAKFSENRRRKEELEAEVVLLKGERELEREETKKMEAKMKELAEEKHAITTEAGRLKDLLDAEKTRFTELLEKMRHSSDLEKQIESLAAAHEKAMLAKDEEMQKLQKLLGAEWDNMATEKEKRADAAATEDAPAEDDAEKRVDEAKTPAAREDATSKSNAKSALDAKIKSAGSTLTAIDGAATPRTKETLEIERLQKKVKDLQQHLDEADDEIDDLEHEYAGVEDALHEAEKKLAERGIAHDHKSLKHLEHKHGKETGTGAGAGEGTGDIKWVEKDGAIATLAKEGEHQQHAGQRQETSPGGQYVQAQNAAAKKETAGAGENRGRMCVLLYPDVETVTEGALSADGT
eukprot:g314.t1